MRKQEKDNSYYITIFLILAIAAVIYFEVSDPIISISPRNRISNLKVTEIEEICLPKGKKFIGFSSGGHGIKYLVTEDRPINEKPKTHEIFGFHNPNNVIKYIIIEE